MEKVDPSSIQRPAGDYTRNDVLFGRGGGINVHPGNRRFRDLINANRRAYLKARKNDKSTICRAIVRTIREMGGGFLKKNKDGQWYDVGDNGAREKTSQALRQRAPEMRKILFENEQRQVQAAMLMQQQQQMAAMQAAAAANGGVMPANMMAVPAPGGMQMVQVNPATMVNAQTKQPATEQKKKEDEEQTIEDMANDTASIASCMMSNAEVDFEEDDQDGDEEEEAEQKEEVKAPAKVQQVAV